MCLSFSLCKVRPRCDSMFPISERIGTLGAKREREREWERGARQSCHSGLGICRFSIGVRQCWWEKNTVYQMSLLNIAQAAWASTRAIEAVSARQISSLRGVHFRGWWFLMWYIGKAKMIFNYWKYPPGLQFLCQIVASLADYSCCGPPQTSATYALHMDRHNTRILCAVQRTAQFVLFYVVIFLFTHCFLCICVLGQ